MLSMDKILVPHPFGMMCGVKVAGISCGKYCGEKAGA
jgi:hypothetical protein